MVRPTARASVSLRDYLYRIGIAVGQSDKPATKEYKPSWMAQCDVLENNLLDFKIVLDRHSISFFLAQGTLLAAARDGQFFKHSIDCDLHVYWRDRYRLADAVAELVSQRFCVLNLFDKAYRRQIQFARDGEHIDINFLETRGSGLCRHWFTRGKRYPPRIFDEGESIQFLGQTFLAPRNIVKYLRRRYGPDWRTTTYKLRDASRFNRICDDLELDEVSVAIRYPLWPFRIFKYSPVSLVKIQNGPERGMVVLFVSGERLCLRYVRDVRADGSVKVHGSSDSTALAWWPGSSVLARAKKLHTRHGVAMPLEGWFSRQVFRYCSVLASESIRRMRAVRPEG